MNPNVFVGAAAGYSNTTGSQNTAFGYTAGYGQTVLDSHSQLLSTVLHISLMLKGSNVDNNIVESEIPAVADAYVEFKKALDRFELILKLTNKEK
jgi:hypothetical protein